MQYPIKLKTKDGIEKQFWLSDEELRFGGDTESLILVQDTQPTAERNKFWFRNIEGAVEVPDMSDLANKQDVISDIDAIRDGASKGTTALQSLSIAGTAIQPNDGNANIPIGRGLRYFNDTICTDHSSDAILDAKKDQYRAVTLDKIDRAVRAGLISNSQITDADKESICQTIGASTELSTNIIHDITIDSDVPYIRVLFEKPLRWARLIVLTNATDDYSCNALVYLCCDETNLIANSNDKSIYYYASSIVGSNSRIYVAEAYPHRGVWKARQTAANVLLSSNNSSYPTWSQPVATSIIGHHFSNLTPDYSQYNTIVGYNLVAYGGTGKFPSGTRVIVLGDT